MTHSILWEPHENSSDLDRWVRGGRR